MKSSYVALAAVGLTVGGLWYAAGTGAGPEPTAAAAAEPVRVSAPASHDNLTVYFVHGPDDVASDKVVTLQEALDRKWVVVHETGNVNVLAVENTSDDHDLFLQSGDMVKGGKQDRIVSTDLLVPPKSGKVALPAHCVEQSRWRQRKASEAADRFHSSDGQACGKDLKAANFRQNQGGVWKEVAENQQKLSKNVGQTVNCPDSPSSLQLALDNPAVRAKADAYVAALKGRADGLPNVVGVVIVVNGQVSSADVYGSSTLFKKAWPKLLKSAAEEALADRTAGPCADPPTCRDVELFLANATKPDAPTPDAGRGDDAGLPPTDNYVLTANNDYRGRTVSGRNNDRGTGSPGSGRDSLQTEGEQVIIRGNEATRNSVVLRQLQDGSGQAGGANPAPGQPAQQQLAAQVADTPQPSGARGGRNPVAVNRVQNPGRVPPQPQAVTTRAGNGNQLDVTRAENTRVLYIEARNPAQPSAVVHRSLLTK
jgi:hypothetical protein